MFNPLLIIQAVGIIGVIFIVFAETGLFFGFFFPGDSLLFTAGLLASQNILNIWALIIGCILAAILGDTIGYWTGKKYGRSLFNKEEGFFFKKKRLIEAEEFYKKHGKFTIIIARFVPIVRTFAPIVAGIGKMKYKTFISYNIIGGIFWAMLMLLSGYFLGGLIPNPDRYVLPIIFIIIIISFLPVIFKFIYNKKKNTI
ncbi:MAG TPA: VTT domain-containing protein [Candidatus Paceibacterota bacterium]|nr:VTT domain-containing protein [Candidatus Paceibacterota bacterium]